MSYSDFTLEILRHDFAVMLRDNVLFDPISDLMPSPWLRESLDRGMSTYIVTEKARSEFIVAPILMECRQKFQHNVTVFSGASLNVDAAKGLTGECDFILARTESKFELQAPLMLVLEAKKNDIDLGLGQCAAQMLAACRFNQGENKPVPYLYGCVTTGELWQFLKLQGNDLQAHPRRFAINEISKILWFLVECLKDVDQQASEAA